MTGLTEGEIALMRADFQSVHLTMRCKIERFTELTTDRDGHPIGTWGTLHEDLPCWYHERERSIYVTQEITGPEINVVDQYPHLLLPIGTDVTPADRVTQVTHHGVVIMNETCNIKTQLVRLTEILLTLEKQF